jgi:hypothetical protein
MLEAAPLRTCPGLTVEPARVSCLTFTEPREAVARVLTSHDTTIPALTPAQNLP